MTTRDDLTVRWTCIAKAAGDLDADTNLHDFPVDIVKIDRSFVRTLGRDAASTAIMDAIVNLAHALDLTVVAEGMETVDQYEQMAAFSCEAYQGFYFAAPVAADEIALLLQRGLPDDRRPRPRRQDGPRGATQLR